MDLTFKWHFILQLWGKAKQILFEKKNKRLLLFFFPTNVLIGSPTIAERFI